MYFPGMGNRKKKFCGGDESGDTYPWLFHAQRYVGCLYIMVKETKTVF